MVLTTTVITLYGPTPTFTVFSTFPRHTPLEVDSRRAVLEPLGLASLSVLLGIACFYLLFKKLQLRKRQQLKAQRTATTLRCRMTLLQATNQLFPHKVVMN